MRRRNKLITTILTMVMVLPFFLGLGSVKDVMAADPEPEVTEQMVTLHKRLFANVPEKNADDADPWGTPNTGDKMEDFGGKPLAGAEFEAYDVTATYWTTYDKATGTDADKTKAAEDAVEALIVEDLTAVATFGPTDSKGEASRNLATKSDGRNAIYLFHETVSPAGVVQSKSVDFILGLPVYDEGTDNVKDEVHVYPKNEVKAVTFEFTKYGVGEEGSATKLPRANFILKDENDNYYDDEAFGSEEADAEIISSDPAGLVTVAGLTLNPGTYEFYEVNSTVSTDGSEEAEYHYGKNPVVIVKVDKNMNVTYDYYNLAGNLVENATGDAKAYNYKVPAPTKEASDHDVDQDQEITFTITQKIPTDIADYTQFALVDTFDPSLKLVNDTEADLLDEIKASMDPEMANLVTGVTIDGNKFTVNFNLDEVKKNAGITIEFKVAMSVKEGADLATDINNEVTFDNNFDDQSATDSVKTYGKSFLKIDVDTEEALAGAKFYVKKGDLYLGTRAGRMTWEAPTSTIKGNDGRYPFADGFVAKELTSSAEGKFSVAGLAQTDTSGEITYELEEFVAPDGYALLQNTIEFVADDGTEELPVANKHKGSLPSTGGSGIVAFVLIGVVAVGGAVLYFTKGRRQIEG